MWRTTVLLGICLFVVPRVYKLIWYQGYHVNVFNHYPGPCKQLPRIENGSEDMQLLSNNKVLIISGIRPPQDPGAFPGVIGRVYLFDLEQPEVASVDITLQGDLDFDLFNPLGLTVWEDKQSGEINVYIINAAPSSTVESFRFVEEKNTLYHIETIKSDHFKMLNNIVAVGPKQFYFTNFFNSYHIWELLLQLRWGDVGYFDGQNTQVVADGLFLANGIERSPDGRFMYVNKFFDKEMLIYSRQEDNTLKLLETVPLYMAVDNLFVDQDTGDIWVAGTPHPYKEYEYVTNPKNTLCSSQVLRLRVKDGHVSDITAVFTDDGRLHSAASVAIYKNNKLLLGSIATTATYCDVRFI